jgi:two-component system sensor histidine kinase RegB
VAHEIGTPLSSIMLLSEELQHAVREDVQLAPYAADLKLLEQQVALCQSALARLRVRAESGARQSLSAWLPGFVEQWRLRHPHVDFEIIGPMVNHVQLSDTVAVGQILTILLDNAARASRDFVTLEARVVSPAGSEARPHAAVDGQAVAGREIEFLVCDRGPGVPAELRDTLGSVPVESTQGGQGVGLYLAYATAAQLSGSIALRDAPERGTLAVLRLPEAA